MYLRVKNNAPVSHVIAQTMGKSIQEGKDILRLGAVYYQPKEEIEGELGNSFEVVKGALHFRRIMGDFLVSEGDAIRFYPNPRRHRPILQRVLENLDFSRDFSFDWNNTVLEETENYLVLKKPAGIPCHASVSNYIDNILWIMQNEVLNATLPPTRDNGDIEILSTDPIYARSLDLFLPQRLDTDTSGLLLVAKTSLWISQLGKLLQKKKYRKWYKLLLCYKVSSTQSKPVMDGTLLETFRTGDLLDSFIVKTSVSPKEYFWTTTDCQHKEVQDASLRIEQIGAPIVKSFSEWMRWQQELQSTISNDSPLDSIYLCSAMDHWLSGMQRQQSKSSASTDSLICFQEITVELLTGRTHQIRGQFQALQRFPTLHESFQGCDIHIAGDHLYPGASYPHFLQEEDDMEGSSPFLALVSYGIELDLPFSSHPKQNHPSQSREESTEQSTATDNQFAKRKKRNVLEPLKVNLGKCWWSLLYENI